jgi:hypothetical protein
MYATSCSLCTKTTAQTRRCSRLRNSKYLLEVIKPEWVIDTYYPKLQHGSELNIELRKFGFLNN